MDERPYVFDETLYPVTWRFNARDCGLSDSDKQQIVLLDQVKSAALWDVYVPVETLMSLAETQFQLSEKVTLDFNRPQQSSLFFEARLGDGDFVWFFWGRECAAQVPRAVFIKGWSDFFYPSDENSVLVMPERSKVIFSFEEDFFCGQFLAPSPVA
ncbi:hypothetical protein [Pseudomonas purpurea]|uniref:hypothetical protein n=1 Tax=Pseudomonas purpurea TaxID=3136737 RepID=UPI00326329A5